MKRFSLAELRVVDSDDDSDEFASPERAPIARLRSIATASPGGIATTRQRPQIRPPISVYAPPRGAAFAAIETADSSSASIDSSSPMPSTSTGALNPSSGSDVRAAVGHAVANASGGDEMEGRRAAPQPHDSVATALPPSSGIDRLAPPAEETRGTIDAPIASEVPRLSSTLSDLDTTQLPVPPADEALVGAMSTDDLNTAHEVESTTYMEESDTEPSIAVVPPPALHALRTEPSPLPRPVEDSGIDHGKNSMSPHFKISTAVTPHMRTERRHRDPHHEHRDDDSDAESVQFVELGTGERHQSSQRELSAVKACALVLDDGREITPDPFVSGSDDDDFDDASIPDPQVFAEVNAGDYDVGLNSQRGESYPGRFSGRSGTATGNSLYHQRLSERHQAQERRAQAELERQWQELTFRPNVSGLSNDFVYAQPYFVRLHADAAKKHHKTLRASQARKSVDSRTHHPVLSERTRELAFGYGSDIYERLYPGKPKPPTPEKKINCGTKAVFARLTAPIRSTSTVPELAKRQGCTFQPEITAAAKKLAPQKSVVDRLFHPLRRAEVLTDAPVSDTSSVF